MSFILSNERDGGPREMLAAFEAYRRYVQANQASFPPSAFALASSDWYFDSGDHRCPHDAWLERLEIDETGRGLHGAERGLEIRVRLLGACHDCFLELTYADVHAYRLCNESAVRGNDDWRYDEFRVTPAGRVVHEIEWAGGARWRIDAADVRYEVLPLDAA